MTKENTTATNQAIAFNVTYFKTNNRRKAIIDYENKEISFYPVGLLNKEEPPLVIPFDNLKNVEIKKDILLSAFFNHKSQHYIELSYIDNSNEIKTIGLSTSVFLYRLHPLGIFRGIPQELAHLAELLKEIANNRRKGDKPGQVTGEENYPKTNLTGWRYWAKWLLILSAILCYCCFALFVVLIAGNNSSPTH